MKEGEEIKEGRRWGGGGEEKEKRVKERNRNEEGNWKLRGNG